MSVNVNFDSKIDKIFADFKKLSPALIAVAIASGLILFLPYNILERMALDKLPEEIREVVILFFFQEISQKEIARMMGIKLSLVKYRVSRAKKLLAKYLGEGE